MSLFLQTGFRGGNSQHNAQSVASVRYEAQTLEARERKHPTDSIEKLLSNVRRGVIRGPPTINRVTIVDPGSFCEVDFFLQFRTVSFSTE